MSIWVANGRDHSQTVAGKITTICSHFHAIISIVLWKLQLESIRKAHFIVNKQICLHQKFIS